MNSDLVAVERRLSRDLRIDLFRGIALLMIFVSHVEVFADIQVIRPFTLVSICYCDALEVFVFLSGVVSGRAYGSNLAQVGYWSTQLKSLRRCGRLYAVNITIFVAVALILYTSRVQSDLSRMLLDPIANNPAAAFGHFLIMQYHPIGLNVLYLYVLLTVLTAPMLWLTRYSSLGTFVASFLVYLVAFNSAWLSNGFLELGMNVFAWQFVFVLGLLVGSGEESPPSARATFPFNVLWTALLVVFVGARMGTELAIDAGILGHRWSAVLGEEFVLTSKYQLHPLRVANLVILAQVAVTLCPDSQTLSRSKLLRPLITCGKHSLLLFAIGIVLSYASILWLLPLCPMSIKESGILLVETIGMGVMGLTAAMAERLSSGRMFPIRRLDPSR